MYSNLYLYLVLTLTYIYFMLMTYPLLINDNFIILTHLTFDQVGHCEVEHEVVGPDVGVPGAEDGDHDDEAAAERSHHHCG